METIGSLVDKLSINELKIYHMTEQAERDDVDEDLKSDRKMRLSILHAQRDDLIGELQDLMEAVLAGKRELKLYRQMKMYNEEQFKDRT